MKLVVEKMLKCGIPWRDPSKDFRSGNVLAQMKVFRKHLMKMRRFNHLNNEMQSFSL